jgi:hypothetical protein
MTVTVTTAFVTPYQSENGNGAVRGSPRFAFSWPPLLVLNPTH